MRRILIAGFLVCAAVAFATAQITPIYNWLGTETLRITLDSGSGVNITLSQIRNSVTVSQVGAATQPDVTPSGNVGMLVASGAITTWNAWLPNPATHGQEFCLANGTNSVFTANTSVFTQTGTQTQTLNTPFNSQNVSPVGSVCWVYNMPTGTTGTWFKYK